MRKISIVVAILFLGLPSWATFETPRLVIKNYQLLDFPPQLSKSEIQFTLERTAKELHGNAFVDLGAMSDFMHGHALFYPHDVSMPTPTYRLTDKAAKVPWSDFSLRAVLFHTQEYAHLRPDREYRNKLGEILDPLNRNWLFWNMDNEFGIKGSLTRANLFDRHESSKPRMTVSSGDLNPEIFGKNAEDFEYSFYFFRVQESDVQALNLSPEEFAASNILKIELTDQSVYLVLVNFHCRNHTEDQDYCGGAVELAPYY